MAEQGKITMSEFKTVVERFEENQKKIIEVMNHRFDKVDERFNQVDTEIGLIKRDVIVLK